MLVSASDGHTHVVIAPLVPLIHVAQDAREVVPSIQVYISYKKRDMYDVIRLFMVYLIGFSLLAFSIYIY